MKTYHVVSGTNQEPARHMTANHPEDLVERLKETAGKIATSAQDGDAELWASAEAGLWDAATTITSLVGERDALRAVTTDPVGMRVNLMRGTIVKPDDLVWLYDTNGPVADIRAQLAAAESTIRNRDETIAAQAVEIEAAKLFGGGYYDPTVTEDTRDYYRAEVARFVRALASPHQEGTET